MYFQTNEESRSMHIYGVLKKISEIMCLLDILNLISQLMKFCYVRWIMKMPSPIYVHIRRGELIAMRVASPQLTFLIVFLWLLSLLA